MHTFEENPAVADMTIVLIRELEGLQGEIRLFADDSEVWRTLPGVANSAGNIALHLAGNVQHYIGTVLGGSGYVRDRDLEFSRRSGTRAELVAELDRAIEAVRTVLPRLSDETLNAIYPEPRLSMPTRRFLLHLCTHAAYHLGQAGYLRRTLTPGASSSGALSPLKLA